jgi:two-component system sensor histidine kinase TctE
MELQPLVGAINGYVHRLDSQMAARNRFIANASHQLRTPFTVLQTQVDFGLRSPDPAQKDEALRALFQGVRDGTRLVNQLLSLSTAEVGAQNSVPFAAVDVMDLVQRVLEEKASLAQARDIDLGFEAQEDRLVALSSDSMLHELVANLVDNALRYTPAKGVVTVSMRGDGGWVLIRVEDNGPGIPPEDRKRVFERFCRLHPGDSQGSGLGLAIVKELATALGAGIQLEDPPEGTGLVVTVTCPAG